MTDSTTNEGTGRRVGLASADVVAAALDLIEREGPDALTMRRLAAVLDVTATTIYWHVGSRDELVTEVIRLQSQQQAARPIRGATPRRRIMNAARHVWEAALEHGAVTRLAHRQGATSLLELPLEVAIVRELEAAGVTGKAAADALHSLLTTVGGFLVVALRDDSAVPDDRRSEVLWATIDDPAISAETIDALARPPDLDQLFETTVQAVIDAHVPE